MTNKIMREGADSVVAVSSRTAAENESQSQQATSPLPWRVVPETHELPAYVYDAEGVEVVVVFGVDADAKADLIVRACNSHDDLLAALKALNDACRYADSLEELPGEVDGSLLDAAAAAIAKAEGR